MALHPKFIRLLPLTAAIKLEWHRTWLERAYEKDISVARKAKDKDKVSTLESDRQFELDLHDEEDDSLLTKALLFKARQLRVPVPHRFNANKLESEYWYRGHYTGTWCLTTKGITALRDEIRKEQKAKHEGRTHWVVWISALTGVIGAITGLVALLGHK